MPNGTREGNQCLGSSSRSVGDILSTTHPPHPFLQCAGSWPFYIMTFSLPKEEAASWHWQVGLCPSGKQSKLAASEHAHIYCTHKQHARAQIGAHTLAYVWKIRHIDADAWARMCCTCEDPRWHNAFLGPIPNLNRHGDAKPQPNIILNSTLKENYCLLQLESYFCSLGHYLHCFYSLYSLHLHITLHCT